MSVDQTAAAARGQCHRKSIMRRSAGVLAFVLLGGLFALVGGPGGAVAQVQCTATFLPVTGDWATASNWSPAAVPAASATACVPGGRTVQVSGGATVSVGSLQGAGGVSISPYSTLSVAQQSAIGSFDSGGTLSGGGELTVNTIFDSRGLMTGTGATIVGAGVTAGKISGTLGRSLINKGSLDTGTSGEWRGATGGLLDNQGTFIFNLGYSGGLTLDAAGATPAVRNRGVFRRTNADFTYLDWRFENQGGEVRISAGQIYFQGGSIPGSSGGGSWTGAGKATLSAGAVEWAAGTQITGTVEVTGANVTSGAVGGTGRLRVSNGTVTLGGDPSAIGTLEITGGTLAGSGSIEVQTRLTQSGGAMSGTGRTTLPVGATGVITGGILARELVNNATIVAGPGHWKGATGGRLVNAGTFHDRLGNVNDRGMLLAAAGATPSVLNNGTFLKDGGDLITIVDWRFENHGEVRVAPSYTIQFQGGSIAGSTGAGKWSGEGISDLRTGTFNWGPGTNITGSVVVQPAATLAASDLQGAGKLQIAGTVSLTGSSSIAELVMVGGALGGAGDLTAATKFNWTGGTMTGTGRTIVAAVVTGGQLSSGTLDRTLINRGKITAVSGSRWIGTSNAVLQNEGTFVHGIGHFQSNGMNLATTGATPRIVNTGVFTRAYIATELSIVEWQIENHGEIRAVDGDFYFQGGSVPGTAAAGRWTGNGVSRLQTKPYSWGAGSEITGHVTAQAPLVAPWIQGAGKLTLSSELTLTDVQTPSFIGTLILSGTLNGAGDLHVDSGFSWNNAGVMTGTGRTFVEAGVTGGTMLGYGTTGTLARRLINRGKLTQQDGSLLGLPGAILENHGVFVDNAEGGSTSDYSLRNGTGSPNPVLINHGSVLKTGGPWGTVTNIAWDYDNRGIIHARVGQIRMLGTNLGLPDPQGMPGVADSEWFGAANAAEPGMTHCDEADPVNCSTGNFFEEEVDLLVAGRGPGLVAGRAYNTKAALLESGVPASGLSPGWTHSYASRLVVEGDFVILQGANAATAMFRKQADGTFVAAERVKAALTRASSGEYTVTYPDQSKDVYGAGGRLLRQADRNGYTTEIAYVGGLIDTVTDEAGRILDYDWTDGRITTITDPANRSVHYGYDDRGDLVTVTDVGGGITRYGYDRQHRIVSMRNPRGHLTTNTYDRDDRVKAQTDAKNGITAFTYTPTATTATDPRGNATRYEHHDGLTHKVVHAAGTPRETTATMIRDGSGFVTQRTDPDGQVTKVQYDGRGNVTKITDPLNRVQTMTYSAANDVETITDGDATTTFTYDTGGNVLTVSRPLTGTSAVATTTNTYDPLHPGDLLTSTDPNGKVWQFAYNDHGDRVRAEDPVGNVTTTQYNLIGWPTSSVGPNGNAPGANPDTYRTVVTYDDHGAVLSVKRPLGRETKTSYDANGNPITTTDQDSHITTTEYDELDRPTSVLRPDGVVLSFEYDAAGNRTKVVDGLNQATTSTYDELNRLSTQTDTGNRTTSFGYDDSGRLTSEIDAIGRTTSFGYDAASQLKTIQYSDGTTPSVSYGYDDLGRRTSMVDGTGASAWTYDSLGRLKTSTDGTGRTLSYAYDLGGRMTKLTYPASLVAQTNGGTAVADPSVGYGYDDAGRMTRITDWFGSNTVFEYTRDSQLKKQIYPNGITAIQNYDAAGRLTFRSDASAAAGEILSLPYTRDLSDQIKTQNPTGLTSGAPDTLDYDPIHELTKLETAAGQVSSWGSDKADRLTRIQTALQTTTLEYDSANQLLRTRRGDGSLATSFTYDQLGNRTGTRQHPAPGPLGLIVLDDRIGRYVYDQANRLVAHGTELRTFGLTVEGSYGYDGDGLRADLMWDPSGDLPLILGDQNALYITGPDGLPLQQIGLDGARRFYHHDQLGSTRVLTDANGIVTSRRDYTPYGTATTTGAETPVFGFAGQYTDSQTGLIYMRARWYDPATGQFLTSDPIGLASGETNLYRYAGNNPINNTDPTGLDWIDDAATAGIAIGDTVTVGISARVRKAVGLDQYVDKCSPVYKGAAFAGNFSPGGAVRAIGRAGIRGIKSLTSRVAAQVGRQRIRSVDDVLTKPSVLAGKTPSEVEAALAKSPGWKVETLGRGSRKGQGWVFREYDEVGNPTGRLIRWHPGGGHHGPDPYWRVSSPQGGNSGPIR